MNIILLAGVALRFAANSLQERGEDKQAKALRGIVAAVDAGQNVDNELAKVAIALDNGEEMADWDEILDDLNDAVNTFLSDDTQDVDDDDSVVEFPLDDIPDE